MFCSFGLLRYSKNPLKLIVEVDNGIADFYRSTIPKYIKINKPLFAPHISVVRDIIIPNLNVWGKYNLQEIHFQYESFIYNDGLYYWLNTYSKELEDIRIELGLKPYGDVTLSPDFKHKFHITIGNCK